MPLLRNKIYIAISAYPGISWLSSSRNMQEHPLLISVKNRSKKIGAGCANCRWKPFTLTYWKPWREIRVPRGIPLVQPACEASSAPAYWASSAAHSFCSARSQNQWWWPFHKASDGQWARLQGFPLSLSVTRVSCRSTSGTEPPFQIPWLTKRNKSVVSVVSPSKILVSTVCILLHTVQALKLGDPGHAATDSHRLCCKNHRE